MNGNMVLSTWVGVIQKTCNYIVKYITKDAPAGQKVPRIISSKGLGESYITTNGSFHKQNDMPYISVKGKYRVPLPRYYLTKIWSEFERVQLQIKSMLEPYKRYVDGYTYTDELSYKSALQRYSAKQISIGLSPAPYSSSYITIIYYIVEKKFQVYYPLGR